MTLKDNIETLKIFVNKIKDSNIKWVLVGSTSLSIRGVDVEPHDIDILTNKEGAYKIGELLKSYVKEDIKYRESDKFKSHFGVYYINGIKVEVMGDLSIMIDGEWSNVSDLNSNEVIKYNDIEVPVFSLQSEYEAYIRLSRKEVAKKIADFIK